MQDFVPLTEEEEGIVARGQKSSSPPHHVHHASTVWRDVRSRFHTKVFLSLQPVQPLWGKIQFQGYYQNYGGRYGKAGDCIGRRCEAICPQHLPIVQHMKEIAEVFEPAK